MNAPLIVCFRQSAKIDSINIIKWTSGSKANCLLLAIPLSEALIQLDQLVLVEYDYQWTYKKQQFCSI